LTGVAIGSARAAEGGGAVLLVWAGANARPRREGKSGEGRAHAGRAGLSVEGEMDCGERRSRPKGKKGGRPGCLGWDPGWLFYFLPFSFLILLKLNSI
jgi:hypothetical protein